MPGPSKIYPTLFIGDLSDANDSDNLFDLGVTHVLSVGAEVENKDDDITYLSLSVLDMEDQNILKHFEPAFKYIERARNGGACLVHCNAGVSRSAAICIAYIMKKFKIDVKDATETVSDVRPQICPNPGFVRQLEQYYINLHPELKKKASETVGCSPPPISSSSASETPNSNETTPSAAPSEVTAAATPQEAQTSSQEKMVEVTVEKAVYICRSCRRPLFTVTDLMPHQVSQHSIAYHKRDKNNATSAPVCSSYFLQEPLQWMGNVDENEGKIGCVKCHSKIGFWKWDGQQCSCGTWVTPAIQIAKNRVDERIMPITSLVPASEAS